MKRESHTTHHGDFRVSIRHADGKCEQQICNGCVTHWPSMKAACQYVAGEHRNVVEITIHEMGKPFSICALCSEVNLRRLIDCPVSLSDVIMRARRTADELQKLADVLGNNHA